jgi:Flp pilus assembly protein CpaB
MNPKLVVVMVVAALLIGLLVGAGGGIIGATFVHRLTEGNRYRYDEVQQALAVPTVAVAKVAPQEAIPVLPAGQRAVSIKLGKDQAVAGFVLPGGKVDVLHTRPVPERQLVTETVVQDVQVLAVNRGGDETLLVTLSLTPEQAEDLAKAQNDGTLSLVLRK